MTTPFYPENVPFEVRVLLTSFALPAKYEIKFREEILYEYARSHLDWFSIATADDSFKETFRQNAQICAAVAAVPDVLISEYYNTVNFLEFLYLTAPDYCKPPLTVGANIDRFWDLVNWFEDLVQLVRHHYPVPPPLVYPSGSWSCDVDW